MTLQTPSPKPSQTITISTLMVITLIIGCLLAPIAWWGTDGIAGTFFVIFVFAISWSAWVVRKNVFLFVGCFLVLIFAVLAILPLHVVREGPSPRARCLNNMRQLILACHNFQSANGTFPPPFTVDADGKPLHSWRVLLLPYIDQQALYNDLDLSKPWNDPVNIQHAHRMPDIFLCPVDDTKLPGRFGHVKTPYLAVVGKETVWDPDAGGLSFMHIRDGSSNTIALIESNVNPVHWMSPHDLEFDQIVSMNKAGESDVLSSDHSVGTNIALADGSTQWVPRTVKASELRGACTRDGNEKIDIDSWRRSR